ncbi:MAG: flippase [Thermoplasmata archaeon]|nr:flippase [Thermoplasmata archaeon]
MPESSDKARDGLTSVTRGTLVMVLGTLGSIGFSFVSRVILIRKLTIPSWGTFSLGLTIVGLLSAVATLGLPQAVARNLAFVSAAGDRRAIIRSAFRYLLPVTGVVSVGLFLLALYIGPAYHDPQLALTLEFFAGIVALGVPATLIAAIFQGFEDALPNAVFVQVLNPALFIVFLLSIVRVLSLSQQFVGALGAYLAADIAVVGLLLLYFRHRIPRLLPPGPSNPDYGRRLLVFALPLLVVGALTSVSGSADTLILGIVHRVDVGYYTATLSLARLLGIGLSSVGYIFLPVAARYLGNRDSSSLSLTYATATKWTLVVALPLFIVFFFLPGNSLGFVYTAAYSTTVLPLRIVVVGAFVASLFGPASAAQIAFGRTQMVLLNTVIAAGADVVLSFALIPAYGATGAAVAWSVSAVVFPMLSTIELGLLEGLHPFERHYLLPLVVTAVPVGLLFALVRFDPPSWELPVIAISIAVLFVVVVLVSRSVDRGDRLLLEAVEQFLGRRLPLVRRVAHWLAGSAVTSI